MALVSIAAATAHLHLGATYDAADLDNKIAMASAIILDYLKDRADSGWTEVTAPLPVQMATLILLAHLWMHRGDDPADRSTLEVDRGVWGEIDPLLIRFRDPTLR